MNLNKTDIKKLKEQYIHNLQRLDKAEAYFNTLSDDEYKRIEDSKPYQVFEQLLKEINEIHYKLKQTGTDLPVTLEEMTI